MDKKKNAPAAAAAGTSVSKDNHDLKTLNSDLVKEVAELRKQIEHLPSQLDSWTADCDIPDSIERDVFGLALSSTLGEADESYVQARVGYATEMELLSLLREELEFIIEGSDVTQCSEKAKPEKTRKKNWIFYPIAVTAIFFVSTAVVSLCKSTRLKK